MTERLCRAALYLLSLLIIDGTHQCMDTGHDNIGIGADFDGVDCLPEGISGVEDMYKIFDRLLARGYTEEQAEKISHRNFERIFENA